MVITNLLLLLLLLFIVSALRFFKCAPRTFLLLLLLLCQMINRLSKLSTLISTLKDRQKTGSNLAADNTNQ